MKHFSYNSVNKFYLKKNLAFVQIWNGEQKQTKMCIYNFMVVLILIQALISQLCNYFYLFRTHRGYVINYTLKTVLKIRVIVSR